MYVVLKARPRMRAIQIYIAGRDQKVSVNQIGDPICQVCREEGPVIQAAVFSQTPRDINPWVAFSHRQFQIRVSLVIAKQDVEARLFLLDEVVLKRKSLFVV